MFIFTDFKKRRTKVSTKFDINEEGRTITCIIKVTNEVPNRIAKYFNSEVNEDVYDERKYVGIATCSPEDNWNETFGKRLAEYRAMKQRKADVNNDLKYFIKSVSKNLDNLYEFGLNKEPHRPTEEDMEKK